MAWKQQRQCLKEKFPVSKFHQWNGLRHAQMRNSWLQRSTFGFVFFRSTFDTIAHLVSEIYMMRMFWSLHPSLSPQICTDAHCCDGTHCGNSPHVFPCSAFCFSLVETCSSHHQQLVNKGAIVSNFCSFELKFPTTMFHQSDCLCMSQIRNLQEIKLRHILIKKLIESSRNQLLVSGYSLPQFAELHTTSLSDRS